MLIMWDYFGVMAQDSFWFKVKSMTEPKYSDEVAKLHDEVNLGTISWDEYCVAIARNIGLSSEEVADRYQHHRINQQAILTIKQLPEHTHVLLSNASSEYLLPIMHKLHLFELFSDCYVSSDIGFSKPDNRVFTYVLNSQKVEPHEAVMIDDSRDNIASAVGIGMHGIVYAHQPDLLGEIRSFTI